jgi:hypothetical protein
MIGVILMIVHYIAIHNIMLAYISNHRISWKVKVYFWIEIKGNLNIPLNKGVHMDVSI